MMLDAQRLAGAALCRLGTGGVTLLLHHQKAPAPRIAIRITPTMVNLIAQRIASRAMRTKIARITTPPIMKIVVKSISLLKNHLPYIISHFLFAIDVRHASACRAVGARVEYSENNDKLKHVRHLEHQ